MSDTPRTDEAVRRNLVETTIWAVPIDFARQLERELRSSKAALTAARADADRLRGVLQDAVTAINANFGKDQRDYIIEAAKRALAEGDK